MHAVEEHTLAHGGEGVPGEVEVGHGVHDQIVRRGDPVLQGIGLDVAHLLQGDALHGLLHQGLAGEMAAQIVRQPVLPAAGADAALLQPLVQERLRQLRVQIQDLGHQVLQIHDLHAVFPQGAGKGVVLLLRHAQIGDIVKQELLQPVRSQIQQFPAGAVQQHLSQLADLIFDADTFHVSSPFASAPPRADPRPLRGHARYYTKCFGKFQQISGENFALFLCEAAKMGRKSFRRKGQKKACFFETGVLLYLGTKNALLAQLDRASGYGPEGQGFESLTACHVVADYVSFATAFSFSKKRRLSFTPSLLLSKSKPHGRSTPRLQLRYSAVLGFDFVWENGIIRL